MLDITNDIQSLTTFRRRSGDFMKQIKKTKRPVVLTVKGKAAAVVHETPWVAIYYRMHPDVTYPILEPFTTENLGIAIPKGNPDLVAFLNVFLKKYKDSGEYKKIYQYWFVDMPWWDSVPPKK